MKHPVALAVRDLEQDAVGAAPQRQARAELGEARLECGEAVVQPPAARAAERALAGRDLVEQVEHDDGRSALGGGEERGVVGHPEVIPKPYDAGGL